MMATPTQPLLARGPCRQTPTHSSHRWSDWHPVCEWNAEGQQLTVRLCLTHLQTERTWDEYPEIEQ